MSDTRFLRLLGPIAILPLVVGLPLWQVSNLWPSRHGPHASKTRSRCSAVPKSRQFLANLVGYVLPSCFRVPVVLPPQCAAHFGPICWTFEPQAWVWDAFGRTGPHGIVKEGDVTRKCAPPQQEPRNRRVDLLGTPPSHITTPY